MAHKNDRDEKRGIIKDVEKKHRDKKNYEKSGKHVQRIHPTDSENKEHKGPKI